ncbi:MAG: CBS domain-containing protein [Pseudomonadota bacterium]
MPSNKDLTVITTHINADFDALASLLAAQKIYPEAMVVFPGSQEKSLRNFFINSMVYLFNMAELKAIDMDRVKRLVLVDTRQLGRIGALADLARRPDVEVHVYDHHPAGADDIASDFGVQRLTGATVTILVEILRQKAIPISPDEATIMCLGIYEDTGSFTFSSTTEADFHAAAYLLSQGASLNDVASLISRELNPEQISLLNDMIQNARRYDINGIDVVLTTITTEHYVPDFAFLVHKMVKMENLDAIVATARMANKIYIVARSRTGDVDVGAIVAHFGGGGHPFAAAATVKGQPLAQIEQRLIELLYQEIRPRRKAKDLMSAPPITIDAESPCATAADQMARYSINALLVMASGTGPETLAGFITRAVIEKALYHHLEQVPVRDFMTSEFVTVSPEAELSEIQEKIIDNKQRILPVVEGDRAIGVVTRTDLLNVLVRRSRLADRQSLDPDPQPDNVRSKNVRRFMSERLGKRVHDTLIAIGVAAEAQGCSAYVVGGFVRDLFLYRPNEDMDVVIEGDGIAFAKSFARQMGARVHTYLKFGTAVVTFPDGFKIDVATARMEYYKFPAAMPTVEMSSIKLDLFRRDFTMNTLAIRLNPEHFGILIDFFSAQKDIKGKTVRVLHNLSFVEDPTRVFRAIRFEQRFGFVIGKLTADLIENAVKMDFFSRLTGRRVFTELRLILAEENPAWSLRRLNDYGLLPVVHPSIQYCDALVNLFAAVKNVLAWYDLLFLEGSYMRWAVYFMALIRDSARDVTENICHRFELSEAHKQLFADQRMAAERCVVWLHYHPSATNSLVYHRLAVFRIEALLYMMAAAEKDATKQTISGFITRLRHIQPRLNGQDLIDLGLTPGPIFREIIEHVRDAKLDGRVSTREDELALAATLKNTLNRDLQ